MIGRECTICIAEEEEEEEEEEEAEEEEEEEEEEEARAAKCASVPLLFLTACSPKRIQIKIVKDTMRRISILCTSRGTRSSTTR